MQNTSEVQNKCGCRPNAILCNKYSQGHNKYAKSVAKYDAKCMIWCKCNGYICMMVWNDYVLSKGCTTLTKLIYGTMYKCM